MIKSCLCLVDSECNRSRIIWRQKIYGQFSKEFQCGNKKGNCHIKQVLILDLFHPRWLFSKEGYMDKKTRTAQRHIFSSKGRKLRFDKAMLRSTHAAVKFLQSRLTALSRQIPTMLNEKKSFFPRKLKVPTLAAVFIVTLKKLLLFTCAT